MSLQIETQPFQFNNTVTGLSSAVFNTVSATTFYGDGSHLTGVSNYNGSDLKALTGNWQTSYSYLTANSATFATKNYVGNNFFPLSGGTINGFTALLSSAQVYGNLTVNGNLTATGTTTFANTVFSTTSALSVINTGTGPALFVQQAVGPSDIASFYDFGGVEVMHIGSINPVTYRGKVGINNSAPNNELSVNGSISATGNFLTQGNITAYTAVLANPGAPALATDVLPLEVIGASQESVFSQFQNTYAGVSASTDISIYNDANNYLDIGIASTAYNGNIYSPPFTVVLANDAYAYNADSGNFAIGTAGTGDVMFFTGGTLSGVSTTGGNERLRIKTTGNVGIGTATPNQVLTVVGNISSTGIVYGSIGNSNQWNTAFTNINANSASFIAATTLVDSSSASWNNAYTALTSTSATWNNANTVLATTSGNWNNAYSNLTANSGIWNSTWSTVNANSAVQWNYQGSDIKALTGGWQNTYYSVSSLSAGWGGGTSGPLTFNSSTSATSTLIGANTASGIFSGIHGGVCNTASGNYSTIVNGFSSCATGYATFVGAGSGNRATAPYAVAVGGQCNAATSNYSVIVGGCKNSTSGIYATIAGGKLNNTTSYGFIGGGQSNTSSGYGNFIGGGKCNTASGAYAFIGQGRFNFTNQYNSIIGGGLYNNIGGCAPLFTNMSNVSGNGTCFIISNTLNTCYGFTTNGDTVGIVWTTASNPVSSACFTTATIVCAGACGSPYNTIISGDYSKCTATSLSAVCMFVFDRSVCSGTFCSSFVGGGALNSASGNYNTVVGGQCNYTTCGIHNFIGGGWNNFIFCGACNTIGGGRNNMICPASTGNSNTISGGYNNIVQSGAYNFVGGGNGNYHTCKSYHGVIGGGRGNTVSGCYSSILGGAFNCSCCLAGCSIVGAGCKNTVTANYASVFGGACNTASGAYSFVAAGSANTAGYPNTFVLGTGLSATKANYTYVNNLSVAGNIASNTAYTATAYLSANATAPTNLDYWLPLSVRNDPNGWVSNTGVGGALSGVITPTVPGYYMVNYQIAWQSTSGTGQNNAQIRLNGTNTRSFVQMPLYTGTGGAQTQTATAIVYLNGVSDSLNFSGYSSSATAQQITGTSDGNWTKMEVFKIN